MGIIPEILKKTRVEVDQLKGDTKSDVGKIKGHILQVRTEDTSPPDLLSIAEKLTS